MSRFVAAVLVLLAGWLGCAPLSAAAVDARASVHTYDYDGHDASSALSCTATERGPPASATSFTAYDTVGRWSQGASARPPGIATLPVTTYTDTTVLVQDARATATTDGYAGVTDGDFCPLRGTRSAAKTGAELPDGYSSFSAAKRAMGSPGEGNVFDHVVEQSQIKRSSFAPENIHNPFNMNPVSARTNQIKANYYSSKQPFTGGGTVRDWLTGQSFVDQYSFGMYVLTQIRRGVIQ